MEHLQSFIQDCDARTEVAKRRLKETQEELSEEANSKVTQVDTYLPGLWKYHARLVRPGPISFRTSRKFLYTYPWTSTNVLS